MIAALRNAESRICHKCGHNLPISEFRLRRKDGDHRHTKCNRCHTADEKERLSRKRAKQNDAHVGKLVTRMKNAPNPNKLAWLAELMFAKFGGVEGAAIVWEQQLWRCLKSRDGFKRAFDSFMVMRMLSDAAQPELDEYTTTEDVERQLNEDILRLIEHEPELVADAMRRGGCVVFLPTDGPEFPDESDA